MLVIACESKWYATEGCGTIAAQFGAGGRKRIGSSGRHEVWGGHLSKVAEWFGLFCSYFSSKILYFFLPDKWTMSFGKENQSMANFFSLTSCGNKIHVCSVCSVTSYPYICTIIFFNSVANFKFVLLINSYKLRENRWQSIVESFCKCALEGLKTKKKLHH